VARPPSCRHVHRALDRRRLDRPGVRRRRSGQADPAKAKLQANPNLAWTEDFSQGMIRMIGGLKVLGAIGLVITPLVGLGAVLAPLAAVGLA
jgi:DoxX-like family